MTDFTNISLDRVLGRVKECGDCMEWCGYAVHGKFPQIRIDGKLLAVRRVVWELTRNPIPSELWVTTKCDNPLCVNPDHLKTQTRAKALKGVKRTVSHKANISAAKRAKSALSMEVVRAMRSSDETNVELGKRYGVTAGYVSHLRRGSVWKEYSSPFSGLGAR